MHILDRACLVYCLFSFWHRNKFDSVFGCGWTTRDRSRSEQVACYKIMTGNTVIVCFAFFFVCSGYKMFWCYLPYRCLRPVYLLIVSLGVLATVIVLLHICFHCNVWYKTKYERLFWFFRLSIRYSFWNSCFNSLWLHFVCLLMHYKTILLIAHVINSITKTSAKQKKHQIRSYYTIQNDLNTRLTSLITCAVDFSVLLLQTSNLASNAVRSFQKIYTKL